MANEELHRRIERELGGINEKLKSLDKIERHLAVLNGRVGRNEEAISAIKTKAALIASIFGTTAYFVWDILKEKII